MIALVTGGSGSGKSAWAEQLSMALQPGPKHYLATMRKDSSEAGARIASHRAMRAGKGFQTLECPYCLDGLSLGAEDTVLLECLSNLVANVMYSPNAPADCAVAIWTQLAPLLSCCRSFVIVSNEIFSDGIDYDAGTTRYMQHLGRLNRLVAAQADLVAEIVCGLPIYFKGAFPC